MITWEGVLVGVVFTAPFAVVLGFILAALLHMNGDDDMDGYIEREALIEALDNDGVIDGFTYSDGETLLQKIKSIPAADVVEVRHGKWISASKKANVGMKCSLCGARIKYSEHFNGNHNYCHKCGARMDGKG